MRDGKRHRLAQLRRSAIRVAIAATGLTVLLTLGGCGLFHQSKHHVTLVYVVNGGGNVSIFSADQGTLKPMPGPFASINRPGTLKITPDGRHLYVIGVTGGTNSIGVIAAYSIDGNGLLTELGSSPFAAGNNPGGAAITPNGRYLYVANVGGGSSRSGVLAYAIASDGSPDQLNESPFAAGYYPEAVAVTPDSRYLYVANAGDAGSTPGNIWAFAIKSDGSLVAFGTFATGINLPVVDPSPMAVSPDGRHLYVVNAPTHGDTASIWSFSIASNGSLTKSASATLPANPHPGELTVGPHSRRLFLSNRDSDTVSVFAIRAGGALSPLGSPVRVGSNAWPEGLGLSPDGKYLFVANSINSTISVFAVGADGSLTETKGSPFPARSRPQGVVTKTSTR